MSRHRDLEKELSEGIRVDAEGKMKAKIEAGQKTCATNDGRRGESVPILCAVANLWCLKAKNRDRSTRQLSLTVLPVPVNSLPRTYRADGLELHNVDGTVDDEGHTRAHSERLQSEKEC